MKVMYYSLRAFERPFLAETKRQGLGIFETSQALSVETAILASYCDAVCIFAGDDASAPVLEKLAGFGIRFIAVRAAGYDNVDLEKAEELGIVVANTPAYSPESVAEHATALLLSLSRRLRQSDHQVMHHDFRIDNLIGFGLAGKSVGIIGTGRIGTAFARIMHGFGCRLVGTDKTINQQLISDFDMKYLSLSELCRQADIISLHVNLTEQTRHLINEDLICQMKKGVTLINTARGGCVDTKAVISALDAGHIEYYGADVYEKEKDVFFYNYSDRVLNEPTLEDLLSRPDVLITPHQAFATKEALAKIAETTICNLSKWSNLDRSENELTSSSCFLRCTDKTPFRNPKKLSL
jgi:D-lactate dehydrogenase